jgi:predicted transposase YbfD/YdcC
MPATAFRRPSADEQHVLRELVVRLLRPAERARFDSLLVEHHYLKSAALVGEHVRYVATHRGRWLALLAWAAPARHLRARDQWIGWSDEQRRRRLVLLVSNTRFLILPECHLPNLASRAMKLCLARLSRDWQAAWQHPVVLAESFVDPELFRGTAYKVSGWINPGATAGFARHAADYYVAHDRPKQLWVRELVPHARGKLRAEKLPPAWAAVEARVPPRCRDSTKTLRALTAHLARVADARSRHGLRYPLPGVLALVAAAGFCGVSRGPVELAAFAADLSQGQLRALRFRPDPHTRRYTAPSETVFTRVLAAVDNDALQAALLSWQEQLLGPPAPEDNVIAVDGKALRHARGVQLVSAVTARGQRWLGTVRVADKSNEIPALPVLLDHLDLRGKLVAADALHTQSDTARHIVQERGGDYLFTVKDNQPTLRQTVETLLTPQRFSPSAHDAEHRPHLGTQQESSRNPPRPHPARHA